MTELVKVKNETYTRYEELLIHRDVLRKEAFRYQMAYLREFGEWTNKAFEAKIRIIEKKKIIAYCQARINRGLPIDQNDLSVYISGIMADYYAELHRMLEQTDLLKKQSGITEGTYRKIKTLYRKLARLVHPDMHPELENDAVIKDLWNRICTAYTCNDLKELEDLEVLVHSYLESIHYDGGTLDIPDINERIAKLNEEIRKILETDPYQYKYLLADKDAVAGKKEELKNEIRDSEAYAKELDEVIASFRIERSLA